jgi:hypothetical protein
MYTGDVSNAEVIINKNACMVREQVALPEQH